NGGKMDVDISLAQHDTETLNDVVIPNQETKAENGYLYYAAYNESVFKPGDFGAVARVITDGKQTVKNSEICIKDANRIFIVMGVFVDCPRNKAFEELTLTLKNDFDYEKELYKHADIHSEIFNRVDFSISDKELDTCNEELLLQAFDTSASNEMIEKLYAYGRYLFICSTGEKNTLPCNLVGLFNGSYQCFWAFNMFNVNFQMIYWQALTGNMPSFLKLALSYVEDMIPQFKENAKKIFGCRGILINSVNTPDSGLFKCLANHIVNWTGGAAWVSQHFWDYYRFTQDIEYLREHTLPFMYETALFYEDFVVENENGYYDIYPSVSPENTASNIMDDPSLGGIETCKNATMEIALLKELLTNLLKGCKITGMYPEKIEKWEEMLSKIPPYQINDDGAVKEWTHPYYIDNYCHRHHSHIYPVFPGNEITSQDDIYSAFEKAEDMRLKFGISDQSSWSIVYMACIAARMQRGDFALKMIEAMAKTSLMNNFFTVHNDWRRMGAIYCGDFRIAPFQIDGNIGIPGAINEMLIQSQNDDIIIFPALPSKWEKGHVIGLLVRGNIICNIEWGTDTVEVTLKSDIKQRKKIIAGSGYSFENGEKEITVTLDGNTTVKLCK
ncbi:MAG: glycoside hydrolase family 95 protein, partial [Clostridia bacterium]|nr:glycoside hydrolase family 95 protein [Clostridia bacterium]